MSLVRRLLLPDRPPSVPPGMRVYAVGDIHGRADLLDQLLEQISHDRGVRVAKRTVLIFLGDYIDRGPSSAEVIDRLIQLGRDESIEPYFLMGNHEEVLLRIMGGEVELAIDWLRFGGRQCLASYGLNADEFAKLEPSQIVSALKSAIPRRHREFLAGLDDTARVGDYLFVHAGLRPGMSLSAQSQNDMRWIRSPFLENTDADYGFMVVHGHTVAPEVERRPNRIGIDTGAYQSGRLTALVLEANGHRILQTKELEIAKSYSGG